jgi:flagellar biosynthesis/type III secretory pathway protein FliH
MMPPTSQAERNRRKRARDPLVRMLEDAYRRGFKAGAQRGVEIGQEATYDAVEALLQQSEEQRQEGFNVGWRAGLAAKVEREIALHQTPLLADLLAQLQPPPEAGE